MGRGRQDGTTTTATSDGEAILAGRERELGDLTAVVDAAASRPMSLLLVGDAGLGKTALLRAAAAHARARDFRVISVAPAGAESFGLLRQLLTSCHADPAALPGALGTLLLDLLTRRRRITHDDEPALLTALLVAVDRLTAAGPALVLIDDAHRADRESARLLTQLLGNMSSERVALVLAARDSGPAAGFGPAIARYQLGPLTDEAAARLLGARPAPARGRIRREALRRAAGNPLALITLSEAGAPLPAEFPARLGDLAPTTRRLLLHAALADDAEPVGTVNRAAGGAPDLRDWQAAEQCGLVAILDGRVRFRHPLIRAASSVDGDSNDIQRAHRNLAAATDDPHRRAWHLAAATTGTDESVAAALESTADSAGRRSDHFDEARALQAAAEHSPAGDAAARRYARAAFAAYRTGDPQWSAELYEKAEALTDDADILGTGASAAGLALIQSARATQAFELTRAAVLRRPHDGQVTLTAVAVAATAALISGVAAHREQLPALLELVDDNSAGDLGETMIPRAANRAARASVLATSDPAGWEAALDEPGSAMTGLAEVARMLFTGTVAWLRDDSARATAELHAVWQMQRSSGAPGAVTARLPMLVTAMIDGGKWAAADEVLDRAEQVAAAGDVTLLQAVVPALRAILRALRNDGPVMDPVDEPAHGAADALVRSLHDRAAGLAALAAADQESAFRHFRRLFDDAGEPVHYVLGPRSLPQLAFAAASTGHAAEARRILAGCRHRAGRTPTPRLELLLAHAAALLDVRPEENFRHATGDPRRALQWPLEFAEAQLNFGLWLRRQRRLLEARPQLQAALDTFVRLGAHGHAEQARRSLPASGPPAGDTTAPAYAFTALTAQKQLIARLAAAGMSNQEIAARLAVSPRTVGSHLYDIYPRLGISNRHQLRELLAGKAVASTIGG